MKKQNIDMIKKIIKNAGNISTVGIRRIQSNAHIQGESILINCKNYKSKRKLSLPKLQFRRFKGNWKEYLFFWSQFVQIDKDVGIAPENRFQHLIQATEHGFREWEVVDNFSLTSASYAKDIESFKARFGKDVLLVEVYVMELLM